jgi:hypothetical protein
VQVIDLGATHAVELVDLVEARAGHTATLLTDGRLLIVGGDGRRSVLDSAEMWDAARLSSTPLGSRLTTPRAHHSATLLPSGDVLIVGGVGDDGQPVATVERFVPQTGAFQADPLRLAAARAQHSATLLPTGEVLIWGGVDDAGTLLATGEALDPRTGTSRTVSHPLAGLPPDRSAPALVHSSPGDGDRQIPTGTAIALRFSEPLAVTSVNTTTVRLIGPAGPVAASALPAAGGLLVFLAPSAPLARGTTYAVWLDGLLDTAGLALPVTRLTFTTEGAGEGAVGSSPGAGDDAIPAGEEDTRIRRDPRTGAPISRWQELPPLMAPPGVTAVAGQVLRLNGEPLANVTFEIEGVRTRSDGTGRFLLARVSAGPQVLTMDGATANTAGATYGIFDVTLPVEPRRTTVVPYTIWMPQLDTVNVVRFAPPTTAEVVISTPKIPGFEIRLPPGTVVEDRHGRPVTQLAITAIPPDRPPFPLPEPFAMYFTIQPGGVSLTRGARVVYPNVGGERPGRSWDFWSYQPEGGVG